MRAGSALTTYRAAMSEARVATTNASLWNGLLGDGRPALGAVGAAIAFAGGLAVYLGFTRQLLPHDLAYLDMTPAEIEALADGRVMGFMVHDRVSWGGSLFAVGAMMMWLVAFPLSDGRRWGWWALAGSGMIGFATFASHIPTGYLDTWHGVGTLALIPLFVVGIIRARSLTASSGRINLTRRLVEAGWGRRLVVATGVGLSVSGLVIMTIGMLVTFVPSDLSFMGVDADGLRAINDRLVPLLAHDRVGFAGGVLVGGLLVAMIGLLGKGRSVPQVLSVAGISGFGLTILVHTTVGYTDPFHLAPPVVGIIALGLGLALGWRDMSKPDIEVVRRAS